MDKATQIAFILFWIFVCAGAIAIILGSIYEQLRRIADALEKEKK